MKRSKEAFQGKEKSLLQIAAGIFTSFEPSE
jgi:hypothetical protein